MANGFDWSTVAERQVNLLLESVDARVWAVDLEGRFRLSRGVVPRRDGRSHEDMVGLAFDEYLEPEFLPKARAVLNAAFTGEKGLIRTARDGRELETLVAPLRGADQAIVGAVGMTIDVTEDRGAVRASEQRLQLIVEQSPAFLWTTDGELCVTDLLGEAARGEGLTPVGGSLRDYWGSDDPVGAVAAHERALAGESVEDEATVDGRTLVSHLEPLRDATGETIGVVGVALDVTAERALQRDLLQSQKLEALGRLTGGIAHDFNNMLVAITGYIELAQRRTEDEKTRSYLDGALDAAHRSATLTRQLLAFSRKQTLAPRLLDVNAHVSDAYDLLHRVVGEDVSIALELEDGLPPILVDPSQLEQVVLNLVVNARDALANGGCITLHTGLVEVHDPLDAEDGRLRPGKWVQLCVADDGAGIDPAVRARLFEPFFTTKDAGTGLGLASVLGIVKQSGGELRVESELGEGSTFRIFFPVAA